MLVTQFKNEDFDEGITFIPMHPGYVSLCKEGANVGYYRYDG